MSVDFGKDRRAEAQAIMQIMMRTVLEKPYRGQFQVPNMPIYIAESDVEGTRRFFSNAICAACTAWGAEVLRGAESDSPDDEAPCEDIVIAADIPIQINVLPVAQERAMIEACAEVIRVLLVGPIIAAKEDFAPIVVFDGMPVFDGQVNLKDSALTVTARASVKVITEENPGRSYVLGNEVGQAIRKLAWPMPIVELFYGPNRLRWLDLRSPGHFVHEQVAVAA